MSDDTMLGASPLFFRRLAVVQTEHPELSTEEAIRLTAELFVEEQNKRKDDIHAELAANSARNDAAKSAGR